MAGRVDVDRMLGEMTAKQFVEWEVYARMEPFNELRADYRAASIVTMIANVNRGPKQQPYTMKDFLLRFQDNGGQPSKQTWQQKKQIAYQIATAFSVPALDM